eukprot:2392373-Rhodomonas_salina.1
MRRRLASWRRSHVLRQPALASCRLLSILPCDAIPWLGSEGGSLHCRDPRLDCSTTRRGKFYRGASEQKEEAGRPSCPASPRVNPARSNTP